MTLERTGAPTPLDVLLVDDHRFVATVLGSMLEPVSDIRLHWCEHGEDAVANANALAPAVILQDLVMPGVDGFTLVRKYRDNTPTATTPIIVLSGNDDAASRAQAKAAGADDFMVKLPTKDLLLSAVRRYAGNHRNPAGEALPSIASQRVSGASASAEFMEALRQQFLAEATSRVATLRDAAERHDLDTVRRTAHNLKGSSSIVGAERLAALCAEIEDNVVAPRGGVPTPTAIATVDAELTRVRVAFAAGRGGVK